MAYVKAWKTSTPVSNSQAEIRRMLARYGVHGVSMSEDMRKGEIVVAFAVPDSPGSKVTVPVRLPVSVNNVAMAMYGKARNPPSPAKLEQAERVAWRHLVLWIDAALSASTTGLQTITEAFFAHTVVGDRGERMIEVVEQAQSSLAAGVQRLLTATVQE